MKQIPFILYMNHSKDCKTLILFDLNFYVGLFLHTMTKHRRHGMSLHHFPGNFATHAYSFYMQRAMGIYTGPRFLLSSERAATPRMFLVLKILTDLDGD